jgi:hypothetical protein
VSKAHLRTSAAPVPAPREPVCASLTTEHLYELLTPTVGNLREDLAKIDPPEIKILPGQNLREDFGYFEGYSAVA